MNIIPTKESISEAHLRITPFIHRTPLLSSKSINSLCGADLFFKCENFQKAGAFKMRGASNAVACLNKDELTRGVATHSSGNHAAALTVAAKMHGAEAYIVMPRTAPEIKKKAVQSYGAKITFCEPTLESREETLEKITAETGAYFVHPYNNYRIIEGQATCAKEIFEEIADLDFIVVPVGGGGLAGGTCLSTKYFSPNVKTIGVEPKAADDAFRSLRDGKIYPSINPDTIADGLRTQLSEKTFDILRGNINEIFTVSEESIVEAMRLIWERMKIIVEPSSAVTLAAVIENRSVFESKRTALILSGGNVDLNQLPW